MKIIDWVCKGNVIRFYLGADELEEWWGDDWNDAPYECNAETVYHEYVAGYKDVFIPFDDAVFEPCNGHFSSPYSKEHMKERAIPCIVILPSVIYEKVCQSIFDVGFEIALSQEGAIKYYMGDKMEVAE